MILLLEGGTTRLGWAWFDGAGLSDAGAVVHHGVDPGEWQGALLQGTHRPKRILVANVAGPAFARVLSDWTAAAFDLRPEFIVTTAEAGGVRNAYVDPAAIEVDRWLGMIAGYRAAQSPVCVVRAGTIVSVDAIDARGQHLGGYIVPGLRLMPEALHARTSGVGPAARAAAPAIGSFFGINTAGAVTQGARVAAAALAERTLAELERLTGATAQIYLTGRDAAEVLAAMTRKAEVVPDLALRGLAALAADW
jgi:type III pantothenate kinase